MKSFIAPMLAACLVVAACGGSTAVESDAAQADAGSTTDGDETTTTVAELSTDTAEAETGDDPVVADEDSGNDATTTSSIDDIPEVCRELMGEFLREIEPVVSQVDWSNATMADFEKVSEDFEPLADDFDVATEAEEECNDIELDDDENFELLIEFAEDEAPGVAGFLTFLNELMTSFSTAMDTDAESGSPSTCDDAISFVQDLVDEYDSMTSVPIDQIGQMAEMMTAMVTCSPEQLEFFESPEIAEFLAGA